MLNWSSQCCTAKRTIGAPKSQIQFNWIWPRRGWKVSTPFPAKSGWIGSGIEMKSLVLRAFFIFGATFDVNLCNDTPKRGEEPDLWPVSRYFWYRQFAASRYPAGNKHHRSDMSAGNSLSEPQLNSYIVYNSFSYILFCCITEINWIELNWIETPYFQTYSRRALFDLPKLCMVVELVVPIIKGTNHFSVLLHGVMEDAAKRQIASIKFTHRAKIRFFFALHCLFTLPLCHYNLFKKSFVIRNLFDMAY